MTEASRDTYARKKWGGREGQRERERERERERQRKRKRKENREEKGEREREREREKIKRKRKDKGRRGMGQVFPATKQASRDTPWRGCTQRAIEGRGEREGCN